MDQPRWLSHDEQVHWMAFVLATRLLWSQFERDLQRDARMPLAYYEILAMLSEAKGRRLYMSHLSGLLQISPSRLSHAVARLESEGWIRREACPTDRRRWSAVLTDAGMALLQDAAPVHVESVRTHLLDVLTREQFAQLGAISQALLDHLTPGFDIAEAVAGAREDGVCEGDVLPPHARPAPTDGYTGAARPAKGVVLSD